MLFVNLTMTNITTDDDLTALLAKATENLTLEVKKKTALSEADVEAMDRKALIKTVFDSRKSLASLMQIQWAKEDRQRKLEREEAMKLRKLEKEEEEKKEKRRKLEKEEEEKKEKQRRIEREEMRQDEERCHGEQMEICST